MIRESLLLCGFAVVAAGCTGVTSIEVGLQPTATMNPNPDGEANLVRLKVLRFAGDEVAKAFEKADFDAVWTDPIQDSKVVSIGPAMTIDVQPGANRIPLRLNEVPREVTHIGILALFNESVTGKDRVLLRRDQAEAQPVHLHGHMIDLVGPTAPPSPVTAPKPGS